jgi:lactate dehydrogenase-like 2-hydroxyacid dehydrogenase
LIGATEIVRLKPAGFLISAAMGGIVDESALKPHCCGTSQ